jgi:superfamily II DNA or RNA helicase
MSILTRHGYIISSDDFSKSDMDELTVAPIKNQYVTKIHPFPVFQNNNNYVIVPRYWGEKKFGFAKHMFGHVEKATRLIFDGSLRNDMQQKAADKTIQQLNRHGGGVLSLATGIGKTVISLYVACKLKMKTMIIVHKQFLLDQWEERIKTFVPFARVGRLQQQTKNVHDCDIVIGMLQSIVICQYDDCLFQNFGLIIFDEVHVVPAPVFSRALFKLCAPCMLGLSATPVRKDGLSRVINWFIGPIFFEYTLKDKKEVTVQIVKFEQCNTLPVIYNKHARALQVQLALAITTICNIEKRNQLLINILITLNEAGHKVILFSDRRAHCETLNCMLCNAGVQGALYLGGMKNIELKLSTEKNVIFATYSMAKEGLDIPSLDALVLATPKSDVIQACGRILHGKTSLSPVIVDVVDNWFIGKKMYNKRQSYYKKAGFNIMLH